MNRLKFNIATSRLSFTLLTWFLSLLLFESPLIGQTQKTWQWVKQLGGDSWDRCSGIACDSKNNIYISGSYFNALISSSKSISSSGSQDIFIAKYDENGDLKSLYSGGGKGADLATSMCITTGDNIVISGEISDSVSFGKHSISTTGKHLFVSSIDALGTFNWASSISVKGDASLYMSGADSIGNIFVAGVFTGILETGKKRVISNGKKDIFMARLSPTGIIENLFSFGGEEDDIPGSLSIESSGSVAISGIFGKPFEAGGGKFTSRSKGTMTNSFIAKFNSDFESEWINVLSGDDYSSIRSLKFDAEGNLFATGIFDSKIYVADTILVSGGFTDGFILKYNSGGMLDWSGVFGSRYYDYVTNLNLDKIGGVFITGSLGDTLEIDSLRLEPVTKGDAAMIIQFSSSGKAVWGDCISGNGPNLSDGSVIDSKGNLYLTGTFRNAFEKSTDGLTSSGDQDIFLAKYHDCNDTRAEIFGERSFCPGNSTELSVKRGFTNVVWNDTIQGRNNIMANKPGRYWVRMMDKNRCLLTDTVKITQRLLPQFSLGNDTSLYQSDSLLLNAPEDYVIYQWDDNSMEKEYLAKSQSH